MLDRLRSWFAAPAVARLENELRLAQNRAATTTTNRKGKVASGVEINAGTFGYEPTKALTGSERWVTLQKMQTDAHVSGALRANRLPLLNGSWEFKPAGDNPKDREIADFCNAVLLRRQTEQYGREYWSRTAWEAQRLPEILEMLTSGFSLFVKTWRVVNMKKVVDLSFVEPDSVDPRGWDLDGSDNIVRIKRSFMDPTGKYRMNEPIDARDVALYVWDLRGARFEGTPFVRAMYGPWFRKDFFLRQALIWAQKVGAPAPLGAYPQGWAPEEVNRFAAFIQQLRGTAPAEAYGVFPKGSDGSPADVTFAGSAVGEVDRVGSLIGNENAEIAHAGGTKSQLLGETSSGARAVGDVISETEYTQIEAIGRIVCTWENHGIGNLPGVVEDLVTRNFAGVTALPELTVSGVRPDESTRDLPRLFEAVTAGLVPRHPEIQRQVVERLGFVLPDDAYEMVEDERRTVDTWDEDEAEDDAADEPEQDEEEFSACGGHGHGLEFAADDDARQEYYRRNYERTRFKEPRYPGDPDEFVDGVYRKRTRVNAVCKNAKCGARYSSLVGVEPDADGVPRVDRVDNPIPGLRYRIFETELRRRTRDGGIPIEDGSPYKEFTAEAEPEDGWNYRKKRGGAVWDPTDAYAICPGCQKPTLDVYSMNGGKRDDTVACTSRCYNAVSKDCTCSCGGVHHGGNIARPPKPAGVAIPKHVKSLPPEDLDKKISQLEEDISKLRTVADQNVGTGYGNWARKEAARLKDLLDRARVERGARANLPEPGDPEGTPASPLPESKEREPGPRSVAGYKARAKKRSAKRTSRIASWTPRSWDDVPESDLSAQHGWTVTDTERAELAARGRGPLLEPIGPPIGKRRAKTRLEASFVDLAAVQDSFRVGEADCLAALRQVFRLAQVELKGRVHAGKISRRSIDTQRRSSFRSYGRAMTELLPVLVACGETGAEHVAQEIERQAAAGTALAAVDPPGMPNRVRVAGRTVLKEAAVAFAEEVRTYATLTIGNLWDRMLVEVLNEYVRLTSQGLEGDALVAEMDRFIDSLSENTLADPARKSSTVAYNQGRDMALQTAKAVGASTFSVRTAVLDEALCEPCLELDGEVVTIGTPEYKAIMPPAKCLGKDRCRCFMVGVAERFSTDLVRPIENWTPEMIEERFPHIRVIR